LLVLNLLVLPLRVRVVRAREAYGTRIGCNSGARTLSWREFHRRVMRTCTVRPPHEHLQTGEQLSQVNATRSSAVQVDRHHRRRDQGARILAPQQRAFDVTYASVGTLRLRAHSIRPTSRSRRPCRRRLPPTQSRPVANTIRFLQRVCASTRGIAKGCGRSRIEILRRMGSSTRWSMRRRHGAARRRLGNRGVGSVIGKQGAVVARIPLQDERSRRPATTSAISRKTASAITNSRAGTGKSPDACAASRSSAPMRRAPTPDQDVFILGVERGMEFVRKLGDVEASSRP